ncbi:MAG: DnaD domain protein [Firmicutes bacterium]|uniref:Replicative DNA helicase loader DnaB n=1 Tax=Melghirimyces thermohalophilus TaxID=1236220 RepID=A0A1G6MPL9_9BACL|nr:DnaD domain protein [Melghirimyces thermohalophilus]MDA8353845.1 DnaD domain protein [Bacillota bacterium]SDC56905.1 replicative DNA helicase loader DnaB [Melghirimyces thermohalophilus]
MSIAWKDNTPGDMWISHSRRPVQPTDQMVLLSLYQPLIGAAAVSLYLTLYHCLPLDRPGVSRRYSHLDLMKMLQLPLDKVVQARYRLEGVGLLNTFQKQAEDQKLLEYELVPPLSPVGFFQSDVLSVSLINRLGKDRFRDLYEKWVVSGTETRSNRGNEITKSFQDVFQSLSPAEIRSAAEVEEELPQPVAESDGWVDEGQSPDFSKGDDDDLTMVKARLRHVLKESAWTSQVEEQIREIQFLYRLDDWDLIRALQNPYVTQQGEIDFSRLRSFVRSQYRMSFGGEPVIVDRHRVESHKPAQEQEGKARRATPQESEEERHFRMLNEVSPMELLAHFQKGNRIPKADLELVEDLINNYGLPTGVINVLLEYVLYSYDYKLPRALVEKIAGHWARKNIRTVEEARESVRKELDWEWKRGTKGGGKRLSAANRKRPKKEDSLPKAVAQAMEREEKGERPQSERVDPETEARLRAKWKRMNQRLNQRMQKKGADE